MLELPEACRAILTDYMFIPDRAVKADCTIVLGMTLCHRPVSRAIELHDQGLAGLVIFSGGYNRRLQAIEAREMQALWRRLGRPAEAVQIEAESTNTRENMAFVRRMLERQGRLASLRSVNIVAISYHMRRALETFKDLFGPTLDVGTASYPSQYCSAQGWADDPKGRQLVLSEFEKIGHYLPHRLSAAQIAALSELP